jgi:hypothetical protein
VGGNFTAKVASVVLSYALTKLKQHVAKKRRERDADKAAGVWVKGEADDDDQTDAKAKAVFKIVTAFAAEFGCPDDQMPELADVKKFVADRDADAAGDDEEGGGAGDGDKAGPPLSVAAGWGVKATASHFRDMVDVHRRELGQALCGALAALGGQAVESIRRYRGHDPAAAVAHAIDADGWADTLRAAAEDALGAAAKAGAAGEWVVNHDEKAARRSLKAGLPGRILRAIAGLVGKLLNGRAWVRMAKRIADATRAAVGRAMKRGGDPGDAAAAVLTEPLAVGAHAERAADVEAAAAVNGGRHTAFVALKAAGKVVARRWMTCRDASVRDAHRRAHGQVAWGEAPFSVGGEECSYPGDPALSPKNRCRCRCVAVSISGG